MMMSVDITETTKTMRIRLVVLQIKDSSNDFRNFEASHMHPGVYIFPAFGLFGLVYLCICESGK